LNAVMNLRVPKNAGKFVSSYTIDSFSRRAQLRKYVCIWIIVITLFDDIFSTVEPTMWCVVRLDDDHEC
jgi:hypothetical protein